MKRINLLATGIALAGILVASGCKQEETIPVTPSTSPRTNPPSSTTPTSTVPTQPTTPPTNPSVSQAARETVASVSSTATQAVQQGAAQFQSQFDQAKKFVMDKKYPEAMSILNQLSSLQLSPEQQKTVTDLKTQIQELLATQGRQALTNVLGGGR